MNKRYLPTGSKREGIFSLVQFFLLNLVLQSIRALPLLVCFRLGQIVGLFVYIFIPHYRKLAQKNLSIAFGKTLSSASRTRLAREHFMLLGANMLSSIKIPTLSKKRLCEILTIEDETLLREVIDSDHPPGVVIALSHFGNWEMNAQIANLLEKRRSGAIYQKLRNKALDDLINQDRNRGVITFDRKRDLSSAATFLREGGLVGVLIDQHAGDSGIWIPFFHKLASTSPLAATLAQKTGSYLIHATIHTVGAARWSLQMNPPTTTQDRTIAEITYDLGCQLAKKISDSPADWFWVHNRWKLPSPAFLLARVKRGLFVPEKCSLQPLKLLVRSPNWLGDACMAAPAVCSLKKGRPDLHLTIVTPQKLSALWNSFPEVDEVIEIPPNASPWSVAYLLKKNNNRDGEPPFDVALVLPNSIRTALEVWLARIPRRIGGTKKKDFLRKWLINQPFPEFPKTPPMHQADEYRAVAYWLGTSQ
jgi:lauroyl/myristoyl acyltransferase